MEWIGNPIATESHKKYYDAVMVDDEQVCNVHCVQILCVI